MEEAMDLTIGALTGGCFPEGGYTIGALETGGYSGDIQGSVIEGDVSFLTGDDCGGHHIGAHAGG